MPQNLLDITPWFHYFQAHHQPLWIQILFKNGRIKNVFLPLRWDKDTREFTRLSIENGLQELTEVPHAPQLLEQMQSHLQSFSTHYLNQLNTFQLNLKNNSTIQALRLTRDNPYK